MPKKLQARIAAYLAERKKSAGGFAPVTLDEVTELCEIIQGLIGAKYEEDPDGDLPVRFKVIDRTKYEPDHYLLVPNTTSAKKPEDYEQALSFALTNVKIAADRADIIQRCMMERRRQQLTKGGVNV